MSDKAPVFSGLLVAPGMFVHTILSGDDCHWIVPPLVIPESVISAESHWNTLGRFDVATPPLIRMDTGAMALFDVMKSEPVEADALNTCVPTAVIS